MLMRWLSLFYICFFLFCVPLTCLRVPPVVYHYSRQSAHEGGKVVSTRHRPPLPQEISLVLISVRGWVDPRTTVGTEKLSQWKIPMIPIGNQTRDLPTCSAVPQPSAPPCTPYKRINSILAKSYKSWEIPWVEILRDFLRFFFSYVGNFSMRGGRRSMKVYKLFLYTEFMKLFTLFLRQNSWNYTDCFLDIIYKIIQTVY